MRYYRPKIKVCGITNLEDALFCAEVSVDALGFIFANSPRQVSPEQVQSIAKELPPLQGRIGVFVDEQASRVNEIAAQCKLDMVQLHGSESPEYCAQMQRRVIKVLRPQSPVDFNQLKNYAPYVSAYLFDTWQPDVAGGTGQTFPWKWLQDLRTNRPWILSGGINEQNLPEILHNIKPYAIDVNSSLESFPGKKDRDKVQRFMQVWGALQCARTAG